MEGISIWMLRLLVNTYPNDADLGKALRELVKEDNGGRNENTAK